MQSEEGGRFFEEQNRNMIVEVRDSFPIAVPDNYCWMTLPQLHTFMMFNNFLNIAARSLISALAPRGGARR
jgi:oxidase EvaA